MTEAQLRQDEDKNTKRLHDRVEKLRPQAAELARRIHLAREYCGGRTSDLSRRAFKRLEANVKNHIRITREIEGCQNRIVEIAKERAARATPKSVSIDITKGAVAKTDRERVAEQLRLDNVKSILKNLVAKLYLDRRDQEAEIVRDILYGGFKP